MLLPLILSVVVKLCWIIIAAANQRYQKQIFLLTFQGLKVTLTTTKGFSIVTVRRSILYYNNLVNTFSKSCVVQIVYDSVINTILSSILQHFPSI